MYNVWLEFKIVLWFWSYILILLIFNGLLFKGEILILNIGFIFVVLGSYYKYVEVIGYYFGDEVIL